MSSVADFQLHPKVETMLEKLPRGLHTNRVFLMKGKPFDSMKKSYRGACDRAGIKDFTFLD